MKLKKCYVSSFGKLKDFTYEFNDGLNIIKEDNGWGKSTFATFIKSVFYGLNDSKRNISDNERLHFKPWNSSEKFGGYIEFEWGGRLFKIERFFGNKESEDTLKLFDLDTGKEHLNTQDIGKRIFEIDEEGFLSTTFFSQKDFQVKSNTSITSKFNQSCEMHDSESFDKALTKLEDKIKTFKYRGDKGLISDVKREIYDIDEKIENAKKSIVVSNELKLSAEQIDKEIKELDKKIKVIAEQEKVAAKAESLSIKKAQFDKLNEEKIQVEERIKPLKKVLNGRDASVSEIEAYFRCNNDLEKTAIKVKAIAEDMSEFDKAINEKKEPKKNNPYMFFAGGAFILVAVIFAVFMGIVSIPVIISSVLSVACIILGFLYNLKAGKNTIDKNSYYAELVEKKKLEYNDYKEIEKRYAEKIDEFLNTFNISFAKDRYSALVELNKVVVEYDSAKKRLSQIDCELKTYENEDFSSLTPSTVSVSVLQREKDNAQQILAVKMQESARKKANAKYYDDIVASISDLENTKVNLQEKEKQFKVDYELLKLTLDFLKRADENLKIKYRAPLQDSLSKYLSYISPDEKKVNIDIDMIVSVEENGREKSTDYYSKGYQNLFEICKRFALTDVLFKSEKPFVVLDDPFYNLDDKKISACLSLIKKLAKEYQIIYFICHESRRV